MPKAALAGLLVFGGVFVALMAAEWLIHRIYHDHDRSYRWGVWTFAILAGVWAFFSDLGR